MTIYDDKETFGHLNSVPNSGSYLARISQQNVPSCGGWRIASWLNKMSTVLLRINAGSIHLIFNIFWRAFIQGRHLLQNTEKVTILYIKFNDIVVFFYPKNGIILFVNHIIHPFLCLCR